MNSKEFVHDTHLSISCNCKQKVSFVVHICAFSLMNNVEYLTSLMFYLVSVFLPAALLIIETFPLSCLSMIISI